MLNQLHHSGGTVCGSYSPFAYRTHRFSTSAFRESSVPSVHMFFLPTHAVLPWSNVAVLTFSFSSLFHPSVILVPQWIGTYVLFPPRTRQERRSQPPQHPRSVLISLLSILSLSFSLQQHTRRHLATCWQQNHVPKRRFEFEWNPLSLGNVPGFNERIPY